MTGEVLCSICSAPMELLERLANTPTAKGKSNHGYQKFRFECNICDRTELRFTGNKTDSSDLFDYNTEKAVDKMHKEQENNNL